MKIDNKNYTLGDLISCIGNLVKRYEEDLNNNQINGKTQHRLIKTKDVVKEYPILTIYALDKAVKENKISYTRIGNTNYFDVEDIESFITSGKRKGDD